MALKPDRNILEDDISFFYASSLLNTSTDSRGGVVVATGTAGTSPSGSAMDQSDNQATYVAVPSGYSPLGMMLVDVVNIDLTRQILNPYKSEAQVGDKIVLMRKGWAVTNSLDSTTGTITQGAGAFCGPSGNLTADAGDEGSDGWNEFPRVGTFMSKVDEDGYAKVYIDVPAISEFVTPKS